jgi:sugar phosphate isomerase/epimerase
MNSITRRQFMQTGSALLALAAFGRRLHAAAQNIKVGVTDWDIRQTAKPDSIALAKSLGFDGVEVSLGRAPDRLLLSDPALQERFLAQATQHQFPIASTCLDILHQNYLKSDPLGKRWVAESIPITQKLGARVILLPFFGKGALQTHSEMDFVADYLKEIGPEAVKAGVILGLENTISAQDNARIMDRAQSKAVKVYYDVGNSQPKGFNIYEEIRWLGKDRICQIHLKDGRHYLGQGPINFPKVIQVIRDIGYSDWLVLEVPSPSGSIKDDLPKNLNYVRQLLKA